jgi:hypothetical protein
VHSVCVLLCVRGVLFSFPLPCASFDARMGGPGHSLGAVLVALGGAGCVQRPQRQQRQKMPVLLQCLKGQWCVCGMLWVQRTRELLLCVSPPFVSHKIPGSRSQGNRGPVATSGSYLPASVCSSLFCILPVPACLPCLPPPCSCLPSCLCCCCLPRTGLCSCLPLLLLLPAHSLFLARNSNNNDTHTHTHTTHTHTHTPHHTHTHTHHTQHTHNTHTHTHTTHTHTPHTHTKHAVPG